MKRENLLLLFNGGHQWPSAELLSTAAGWLLQHLKKNTENKFSGKPIQPVLQFKDSGWLYPSWILANQLRKLSSFSLFADSLAGGLELQPDFKKHEKDFISSLDEERNYFNDFTILFMKSVFAENPAELSAYREMASRIRKIERGRNLYGKLSALRCISITILHAVHARLYETLKYVTDDEWNNRTIFHPEHKKTMRLWFMLGLYAWHGKHHTAHITTLRQNMGW